MYIIYIEKYQKCTYTMVDNENNVSLCTCQRTHELFDVTKFS